MALQLDYTTDQDLTAPNAYWVIEDIVWRKGGLCTGTARIYKSLAARNAQKQPMGYFSFAYDNDAYVGGLQARAYLALKADPALAGTVDV